MNIVSAHDLKGQLDSLADQLRIIGTEWESRAATSSDRAVIELARAVAAVAEALVSVEAEDRAYRESHGWSQ